MLNLNHQSHEVIRSLGELKLACSKRVRLSSDYLTQITLREMIGEIPRSILGTRIVIRLFYRCETKNLLLSSLGFTGLGEEAKIAGEAIKRLGVFVAF